MCDIEDALREYILYEGEELSPEESHVLNAEHAAYQLREMLREKP